jgi:hypothetical protein
MTIHDGIRGACKARGARGSVVGWGAMLQAGRSWVRVPMRWNFSSFQPHYGPGVDSASNRNEDQESSWEVKGGRRVSLTTLPLLWADCLDNVGHPQRLTTLWASMAWYRDSFMFFTFFSKRTLLVPNSCFNVSLKNKYGLDYSAQYFSSKYVHRNRIMFAQRSNLYKKNVIYYYRLRFAYSRVRTSNIGRISTIYNQRVPV